MAEDEYMVPPFPAMPHEELTRLRSFGQDIRYDIHQHSGGAIRYLQGMDAFPDHWLQQDWILQVRDYEFSRILQRAQTQIGYPKSTPINTMIMPAEMYAQLISSRNPMSPWLHVRDPTKNPDQPNCAIWHYVRGLDHTRPVLDSDERLPPLVLPGGYVAERHVRDTHIRPRPSSDEWNI